MAQRLVAGFPPLRPGFEPRSGHEVFVVDEVALAQVSSESFGFPCQFSFQRLLHTHVSSGAGIIGQLMADVPSGLSLTQPKKLQETKTFMILKVLHWKSRREMPRRGNTLQYPQQKVTTTNGNGSVTTLLIGFV
jgi:hypothetical protein